MYSDSLVFDIPTVQDVLASQLEYQSIQDKAKEKARLEQEKIDEGFARAYLHRMKMAIKDAITELMSSTPDKTFTSLKLALDEKLVVKTDNVKIVRELFLYEVHRGVTDSYDAYYGTCTSTPNRTFASLFKDLQKVMEQNGYYLTDDSEYGGLEINLRLKKPE